jgi:putative ribosome biogenesis GTPase RsgA
MDDKTYQVLYSTSLGYALYSLDNQISLHKSRGKLFFKDKKILIGDYVKLDESGLIYQIVDRKSSLSRPRLANPDLVLVLIPWLILVLSY